MVYSALFSAAYFIERTEHIIQITDKTGVSQLFMLLVRLQADQQETSNSSDLRESVVVHGLPTTWGRRP